MNSIISEFEKQSLKTTGGSAAIANPASESVTVKFDASALDAPALKQLVADCGFHCRDTPVPRDLCKIHSDVVPDDPRLAPAAPHEGAGQPS